MLSSFPIENFDFKNNISNKKYNFIKNYEILFQLILQIVNYQKKLYITGETLTNIQFTFNLTNKLFKFSDFVVKPVIYSYIDFYSKKPLVNVHLVLYSESSNYIIDPTYEINSLFNIKYFFDIYSFSKYTLSTPNTNIYINFLEALDDAFNINNNIIPISNESYYSNLNTFISNFIISTYLL